MTMKTMKRGSTVARADNPRNRGVVKTMLLTSGRAVVRWINGWHETLPVRELVAVAEDVPELTEVDVMHRALMENFR